MNGTDMNNLAELITVIDAYVRQRQEADKPLVGKEEQDFDWIHDNLQRAIQLQQQGKMVRFHFLYGKLQAAAAAFIRDYVLSESQR